MRSQQISDVGVAREVGVQQGPIVGRSNEGEQAHQMFETLATERVAQGIKYATTMEGSTKASVAPLNS